MTPEREAELRAEAVRMRGSEEHLIAYYKPENWNGISPLLVEALDAVAELRKERDFARRDRVWQETRAERAEAHKECDLGSDCPCYRSGFYNGSDDI